MFKLYPRQILNSRGDPTLEVKLAGPDYIVTASVPAGKSKSSKEAKVLVDEGQIYNGLSVAKAVEAVKNEIGPAIENMDLSRPTEIDNKIIELDGTPDKSHLGANTTLAVSIAVYKAASIVRQEPVYKLISRLMGNRDFFIPTPLFNMINGGLHSHKTLEFQEFHLISNSQTLSLAQTLANSWQVWQQLIQELTNLDIPWGYGDEGGAGCYLFSNQDPFDLLSQAVEAAGFKLGQDYFFGLDAAANNFSNQDGYHLKEKGKTVSSQQLLNYYQNLTKQFPLKLIEDPFNENDTKGWQLIKKSNLKSELTIVADDLTSTNSKVLASLPADYFNAVLVKPNQIGTIKESLDFGRLARKKGLTLITSHRSGETNDPFIADLAVGLNSKYVKFGNLRQGERVAKYNRLLEIEKELSH